MIVNTGYANDRVIPGRLLGAGVQKGRMLPVLVYIYDKQAINRKCMAW